MAILVIIATWMLLAPVAALALSATLRVADRIERPAPRDADGACQRVAEAAAEPVGAGATRA